MHYVRGFEREAVGVLRDAVHVLEIHECEVHAD